MPYLIVVGAHLSDSGKTEKRPVSAIEGAHALSGVVVDDAVANCSVVRAVVEHDVVRRKGIIVVDRPVVENFVPFFNAATFDSITVQKLPAPLVHSSQFWLRENGCIFGASPATAGTAKGAAPRIAGKAASSRLIIRPPS
jgi:hypothetical protein